MGTQTDPPGGPCGLDRAQVQAAPSALKSICVIPCKSMFYAWEVHSASAPPPPPRRPSRPGGTDERTQADAFAVPFASVVLVDRRSPIAELREGVSVAGGAGRGSLEAQVSVIVSLPGEGGLMPYTETVPKTLLPILDRPLLDLVLVTARKMRGHRADRCLRLALRT